MIRVVKKPLREKLSKNAFNLSREHSLQKIGAKLKKCYESVLRDID